MLYFCSVGGSSRRVSGLPRDGEKVSNQKWHSQHVAEWGWSLIVRLIKHWIKYMHQERAQAYIQTHHNVASCDYMSLYPGECKVNLLLAVAAYVLKWEIVKLWDGHSQELSVTAFWKTAIWTMFKIIISKICMIKFFYTSIKLPFGFVKMVEVVYQHSWWLKVIGHVKEISALEVLYSG